MWFVLSLALVGSVYGNYRSGVFDPAAEPPIVTWKPTLAEVQSYGWTASNVAVEVQNKQYKCEPVVPNLDSSQWYEKRQITAQYAITKCECGSASCRGAKTKWFSPTDDRCVVQVSGVAPEIECKPVILDVTANTQGHGTHEDSGWAANGIASRPYATPLYGGPGTGWEDRNIHPYRLQCPDGYKMLTCHVNAPRQHERVCPLRKLNFETHEKSNTDPAADPAPMDLSRPVMYADYANNICQTTSVANSFDEGAGNLILDPFGAKTIQIRCLLDAQGN